jgi:hypothetical protein
MKSNKTKNISYAVFSGLVATSVTVAAGNLPANGAVEQTQLSSNHQVIEKILGVETKTKTFTDSHSDNDYHSDGHTDSHTDYYK